MEKKINIAELLKDCPSGMELDCIDYNGVVTFKEIHDCHKYPILISVKYNDEYFTHTLTKYGQTCMSPYHKCVIFPKGKTTWEGFQRPFKDGDIVCYSDAIAIFKEWGDGTLIRTHVAKYLNVDSIIDVAVPLFGKSIKREIRLATEEEKQELFDAIKANGYHWNSETKTLEKLVEPRFKVGDRIKYKNGVEEGIILSITDDTYDVAVTNDMGIFIPVTDQDNWELVPNKFDITTLVPFESRVLVRDYDNRMWIPTFWGKRLEDDSNCRYLTTNGCYKYCIPYEGNQHLLGTTNDCADFYKTWEN